MSDMDIVSEVRTFLAEKLGRERYELWFGANTNLLVCGKTLIVETANKFSQDWLRRHYRGSIEAAGTAAAGDDVHVEFRLNVRLAEKPPQDDRTQARRIDGSSQGASLFAAALADSAVATLPAGGPVSSLVSTRPETKVAPSTARSEFVAATPFCHAAKLCGRLRQSIGACFRTNGSRTTGLVESVSRVWSARFR